MLTEPYVMFFSPSRAVLSAILRDEYIWPRRLELKKESPVLSADLVQHVVLWWFRVVLVIVVSVIVRLVHTAFFECSIV